MNRGGALLVLTLVSGAAALMYEVVWLRWFRLLFGNTAYAASATLCAFFAGLALGSALFGRLAGRSRRPLWHYGWIELAAAGAALLVPLLVRAYDPIYPVLYERLGEGRGVFVLTKFALALTAMLPASILLGGTLPMLAAAYVGRGDELGRRGSALYATNVLGAAFGAAAGGLLLPELVGVNGTYAVALAGTVAVAVASFALARGMGAAAPPSPVTAPAGRAPLEPLAIAFASGFGVLAFEVLLIHTLGQFFLHTVYTFGSVLVVVLLCLSLGAAFVAASERRVPVAPLLAGALLLEALLLALVPWAALETRQLYEAGVFGERTLQPVAAASIVLLVLGAPVLLVGSVVFPLTFRLGAGGPAGPRLGGLLAANTVGGIAGSLVASFVLLNTLGLWRACALLALGYGGAAILAVRGAAPRALASGVLALLLGGVLLSPANPLALPLVLLKDGERLLAVAEGAHGIVGVVEREGGTRWIKIDTQYQFGATGETRLYERMAHLPLLLHPEPRRVLVIGSATGGLAGAAVPHPVEEIHLVEIVPEVHRVAAEFFAAHNRGVHGDPRTRIVTEDGRNHLRATRERYDVIVEDLFVPQRPSAAAMYTLGHYRDAREHLTEQGIFCQWLALYQLSETEFATIVATFADVFPDATVWRPSFAANLPIAGLVGSAGPLADARALEARARALRGLGIEDAWLTDPAGLWIFYVGPLRALLESLRPPGLNRDDHPFFEFLAARMTNGTRQRFRVAGWGERVAALHERVGESDPILPGRPASGPRAGDALARVNLLAAAGQRAQLKAAWARVRALVPAELLARPDRSVSPYWPSD